MIKYAHFSRYVKKRDVIRLTGILRFSDKKLVMNVYNLKKTINYFISIMSIISKTTEL